MKRTIILLTIVFATFTLFAQKGKVTSALSLKESGKLDKALETIELTVDPNNEKSEKTIPWPKTWEVRGEIYQAVFQTEDENFKKLDDDPLTKAFESYKKALELDEKDKFSKSLKLKLTMLQPDLTTQAIDAFNNENYKLALQSFEQILAINEFPVMKEDNPNLIDTVILFNAGLAAYNATNYEKAIEYYSEVAKYGYNEGRPYVLIASANKLKGDTVSALNALQEGFKKYPNDNNILVEMINIYLETDKTDEAMKYLDLAIEQDPENASFHFAKGTLYDKIGQGENAVKSYEKAVEVDDMYFNAYYNLGAFYYNKGVKQWDVARAVPANDNEKYEEELAKCDQWWDKAIPYMEKCFELMDNVDNISQKSTVETLKNLYYRKMGTDREAWESKYNKMDEMLKNL